MNINQGEHKQESQETVRDEFSQARDKFKDVKSQAKKSVATVLGFIIIIAVIVVLSNCFYIVREDEVATVRELGEIKAIVVDEDNTDAQLQNDLDPRFKDVKIVTSKGLKFKVPFITTVDKDTSKLLTYISNTAKINTRDKIKYEINMFAQWEITHPGIFRSSLLYDLF